MIPKQHAKWYAWVPKEFLNWKMSSNTIAIASRAAFPRSFVMSSIFWSPNSWHCTTCSSDVQCWEITSELKRKEVILETRVRLLSAGLFKNLHAHMEECPLELGQTSDSPNPTLVVQLKKQRLILPTGSQSTKVLKRCCKSRKCSRLTYLFIRPTT